LLIESKHLPPLPLAKQSDLRLDLRWIRASRELPQAGRLANENDESSAINRCQTLADSGRARRSSELVRENRVTYPNPKTHCEYQYKFCQPVEAQPKFSGEIKRRRF
jgi:hypothetical protein